jgi:hypothetical protein
VQPLCALDLIKSGLNLSSRCWVHLGVLSVHFFVCLIHFVQEFLSFYVFQVFNAFFYFIFVFELFSGETRIFSLVYGRTQDSGLTQSGRLEGRVKKIIKNIYFFLHMAKNPKVI